MFNKFWKRTPSTSLCADESSIYGRQRDKEAFLELILSSEAFGNCGGSVFAIVGMAGVGKTTLAQLVYNDHRVMNSFDFKRWVFVSDNFDVVEVTKSILQDPEFTTTTYNGNDLDLLQSMLRGKLSKKKFFIVLDDVWNENYKQWEFLCKPFAAGAPGSIIIVTTRNKGVSTVMDAISPYHLNFLSNDDCLSVFAKHALIAANGRGYVNALQDGSSWEMEAQFDFSPGCNWLHLHYLCGCCNHEITFATTLLLWLLSLETLRTSSSRQVSSIQLARTKMAFPHNEVELSIVGAATSYVNNVRNTITALVLFLVQLHSSFFEDMK
ncbi:hypothetical protein GH714_005437 [Hevea brasiliensis]|uniref:NB-ARC domain-containing protein n=1 Tax=Hevea brasiliensis TaxID=3981 RepID=A0A6A6L0K3_HEVBR|nr:hypothetical protein GH714_005437 [Hevea brasiliensis]